MMPIRLLLFALLLTAASLVTAQAPGAASAAPAVWSLSFAGAPEGVGLEWLRAQGFKPEGDVDNASKIAVAVHAGALTLEAKASAAGMLLRPGLSIGDYSAVEIEWGVLQFPAGVSYEAGRRSEAIMVHLFFGTEKLPSGSWFVPDSPYFLGLFLCERDRINHPYIGRMFKEGGRYICLDHPPPGKIVVSRFDTNSAFRSAFGRETVPPISGIAISIDTSNASGDGRAKSFIKRISFVR